jgi:hypothetical protein
MSTLLKNKTTDIISIMKTTTAQQKINFEGKLTKIGSWDLIMLPKEASSKLPSRGMVMVEGTINGIHFQRELEPDGKGGHWLRLDNAMIKAANTKLGETVKLEIEPSKEWPEPTIPEDLQRALQNAPEAYKTWMDITPMSRWDWIRWIRATKNPETRKIRIEKTFSKFKSGIRRPCCFNRTSCTIPDVSNNGILLEPTL